MKRQIAAHRALALIAGTKAAGANADDFGDALAANMNAVFAIELALKSFFMTFFEQRTPKTHNILDLYRSIPAAFSDRINEIYRGSVSVVTEHPVFALRTSSSMPLAPTEARRGSYQSALECLESCKDLFVRSRYFYEEIDGADWAVIEQPLYFQLAMIDAINLAYDEAIVYLKQ